MTSTSTSTRATGANFSGRGSNVSPIPDLESLRRQKRQVKLEKCKQLNSFVLVSRLERYFSSLVFVDYFTLLYTHRQCHGGLTGGLTMPTMPTMLMSIIPSNDEILAPCRP